MNLQFSMADNVAAKPSDVRELVVELITEDTRKYEGYSSNERYSIITGSTTYIVGV